MKSWILALLAVMLMLQTQSQGLEVIKDPEAKALIDELLTKANSWDAIYAEFSFTFEDEQEQVKDSYDGLAWIKGEQYKLALMGQTIFCDGSSIYTMLEDVGEVNITTRDTLDDSFLNNPRKLFTGYEEHYKYKYLKEYTSNGSQLVEIELYPKNLDQGLLPENGQGIDVSKIHFLVDKTHLELLSVHYFGKQGTNFKVKFNLLEQRKLDDSFFQFRIEDYPQVEVYDLRD